ncbi:MAG: hypothetical protein ACI87E_005219 [Mariniblastus sp.]|jgi:hypothetical protein
MKLGPSVRFSIVFSLGFVSLMMFTSAAQAQFDLEEYLKRKDVNRNGRVEPEELSSNARGILKKMGFDDRKSNSISKIISKANKDRAVAASSSKASTSRDRKVSGFGVEGKTDTEGVSRFGASRDSGSSKTKIKFSASVTERVESTIRQYDRNKNGVLDKSEISSARWGSPSPEQNDTNRDGRLSKEELSNRYAAREKQYGDRSRSSSTDRSRSISSDRKSSDSKSSDSKFRTTRSSSTPSSSSSSSTTGSSGSDDRAARAKYERYAASLVTQYDADKDGKLSKDETKKMRRPPAGADVDKDGFITKDELVGSLSGTNKKSTSSSSKVAVKDSSSKSRGREYTRGSSSSSSSYRSSSSFDKLDGNEDKQVQMHEFASKWDDKTVSEFYEKDRNGDGVITLQEWSGK